MVEIQLDSSSVSSVWWHVPSKAMLVAVLMGLTSACTVAPKVSDERRDDQTTTKLNNVVLIVDYRLHRSKYQNEELLKEFYQRLSDQIGERLSQHGVGLTRTVFQSKQLDERFSPAANGYAGTEHVLTIGQDALSLSSYGIESIAWRASLYERPRAQVGQFKRVFQTGVDYPPCIGALAVKSIWQDCANQVADHVVDRLKVNGFIP